MSIVLRTHCQPYLDDVGLDYLHVEVCERHKMLTVVGECGEHFVSIPGIRVSRMAPPEKEIGLATELFEAFLIKHAAQFHEYARTKKEADGCHVPTIVPDLLYSEVKKDTYGDQYTLTFNLWTNPDYKYTVRSNGTVQMPSASVNILEFPEKDISRRITKAEKVAISKWLSACQRYVELNDKKSKLLSDISSCAI